MSYFCGFNEQSIQFVKNNFYLFPLIWGIYEVRRITSQILIFQKKVDEYKKIADKFSEIADNLNTKINKMTENITDDGKELFTGLESLVKKTNQIINFTNTPIYNLDNRLDSNQNDHLVSSSD